MPVKQLPVDHPLKKKVPEMQVHIEGHAIDAFRERCKDPERPMVKDSTVMGKMMKEFCRAESGDHVNLEICEWLARFNSENRGRKVTPYLDRVTRNVYVVAHDDPDLVILTCFKARCQACREHPCICDSEYGSLEDYAVGEEIKIGDTVLLLLPSSGKRVRFRRKR